jgi:hypothetical protein
MFLSPAGQKFRSGGDVLFITAFLAFAVTALVFLLLLRLRRITSTRWLSVPLMVLLVAVIVMQGSYLYRGLAVPGEYLMSYNKELSQIIDDDAVITGPYAPALTIDNELKGVIYVFGLANVEKDLFSRFPITHIVSDRSNWSRALKDFPFLKSAVRIAQMVIRDEVVNVYRLPGADVPPTDYERGELLFLRKNTDSALVHFRRFADEYPDNLIGKTHMATALFVTGSIDDAVNLTETLVNERPNNYMLHGFCAGLYSRIHAATNEEKYRQLAAHHDRRARELNPAMPRSH